MPFVLISPKDGDKYHQIRADGRAECGCLDRKSYTLQDSGATVSKAETVKFTSASRAETRGYEPCARCGLSEVSES